MQKQLVSWDGKKTKYALFTLVFLYLLLFLPFWKPVLLGFLFAAACAPIVNYVRTKFHAKRTRIAYGVVTLGLVFFVGLIAIVILQVYSQVFEVFANQQAMGSFNDKISGFRDQIIGWMNNQEYLSTINARVQFDRTIVGVTNSAKAILLNVGQNFISSAPVILVQIFIFLMAYGAFLVMLPRIWTASCQALGLGVHGKEHFHRFEKICGLALGSVLITGVIQSALVTIGAAIGGYEALLLIFAITWIFSMIPLLGAGLVPAVLTVAALLQGDTTSAVIMFATCMIAGISDNIIRAWLFSRAAKSNPAVSIITLLGGIALFGFAGLFLAPVIEQLVMTYAFSEEGEPHPGQVTASENDAKVKGAVAQPT